MKRNSTFRHSMLALGVLSAFAAAANPIVIEAEDPIENLETDVAVLDAEGSEASGLAGISLDRANHGSYAVYSFEVEEAGTYDLAVWYITMNTRWLSLQINDQVANIMACDVLSGGWNGVGGDVIVDEATATTEYRDGVVHKSIPVYCEKGLNYLTVRALYGYSPEEGRDQKFAPTIDRFELTKAAEEIERPRDWDEDVDRISRQCEDYDAVTGNVITDDRPPFTNKRGTSISQNGGTVSYNVTVPEEGVYKLTIWYATMQRRWITVKVNQQVPAYVSFTDFSEGWGNSEGEEICQRQVLIYMNEGLNTITFGQYTKDSGKDTSEHGDSPSMDYFTIDLVNYPDMVEPEKEISMYRAALSDIAKWDGDLNLALISDHNEHTVATSTANSATVTLEFPVSVYVSAYAYATENDTEDWTVEGSEDGNTWRVLPTVSRSSLGVITTTMLVGTGDDVAKPESPVKFVRLNVVGDEPVSLGDFMVFGNPDNSYLEGGLLTAGAVDYETTHAGFDVDDWHEGIDKLFDGNTDSQYTVAQDGDGGMGDADDIRITVFLNSEAAAEAYTLSTHFSRYYLERSPKSWTLEAFDYDANDGDGGYALVDSRESMTFVAPGSTLPFNIENPVSTDSYVLTLKNRRNYATHLSEFQLFGKAFEMGGIENVAATAASAVSVYGGNGEIHINSADAVVYSVWSVSGQLVASGRSNSGVANVAVSTGLYIVKVGNHVAKVAVK